MPEEEVTLQGLASMIAYKRTVLTYDPMDLRFLKHMDALVIIEAVQGT
jgi:hypothetical protein